MIALAVNGKTISVDNATILGINSTFPLILDSSNVNGQNDYLYYAANNTVAGYFYCGQWDGPYYPNGCNLLSRTVEIKLKTASPNYDCKFVMFYRCYEDIQQFNPQLACNAIYASNAITIPSNTPSGTVFTTTLTDNFFLSTYPDVGMFIDAYFGNVAQDERNQYGERITDYIDYIKIS